MATDIAVTIIVFILLPSHTIKIGATKRWSGNPKSTYFYITVGGVKLKINPKQSNGNRQFPGDNDTDILIRQTEYK